jgi:polysaccharide deacetylase 2 family uncharacterized protein YibQ
MSATRRAWRSLALFWAAVLLLSGGLAGTLQVLGPLPEAVAETPTATEPASPLPTPIATPATAAPPAGAPTPAPPAATPPVAAAAAAPPAPPRPAVAAGPPPSAPAAPPLPEPAAPAAPTAERAIPPPDAALTEAGRFGPLPRIGPDGRTPIRAYGRPFERADNRPRVAVVVGGIGLSASLSEEAIRRLPPAVTLAVSPYAVRPEALLDRARARGMEFLLALPMEPVGYPQNDPGDRALLTGLSLSENLDRLDWALSRFGGYVGVVGAHGPMRGERFAAIPNLLHAVQDTLRERGLLYLDPRPGAPSPARAWGRSVDLVLDEPPTRGEVERRLAELERLARERGAAIGLAADPTPVLIERIIAWAQQLEERGVALAPVSALIRRPEAIPPAAQR